MYKKILKTNYQCMYVHVHIDKKYITHKLLSKQKSQT
jgi:hypothetical protein